MTVNTVDFAPISSFLSHPKISKGLTESKLWNDYLLPSSKTQDSNSKNLISHCLEELRGLLKLIKPSENSVKLNSLLRSSKRATHSNNSRHFF